MATINFNSRSMQNLNGATYNANRNMYITECYESMAGNVYHQGVRVSDRIVVKENVGSADYGTFVNGIQIFGYNGNELQLLTSREYHAKWYNEDFIKNEAIEMVTEYLSNQIRLSGASVNSNEIKHVARQMVAETYAARN